MAPIYNECAEPAPTYLQQMQLVNRGAAVAFLVQQANQAPGAATRQVLFTLTHQLVASPPTEPESYVSQVE